MFYTYIKQAEWKPKINIYDLFKGKDVTVQQDKYAYSDNFFQTETIFTNNKVPDQIFTTALKPLIPHILALGEELRGMTPNYQTFNIPKKTGGFRTIAAPDADTSEKLNLVKRLFEYHLKILPHNSAFAYVKGRCNKDALIKHVNHGSNYYLKIDMKDFFPSISHSFIMNQLIQLQTIDSLITYNIEVLEAINDITRYCMLGNGLPQGSPVSPLLTNIVMLQFDYYIDQHCEKNGYCYTRYADDILISHPEPFKFDDMLRYLSGIFNNTPLRIKKEKTRYGSNKGRNWNLGLMVNKDQQITIGYRKKERLRATIFNFFSDLQKGSIWDIVDVQALQGTIAYYRKICPEMVDTIIEKYNAKFGLNFYEEILKITNI